MNASQIETTEKFVVFVDYIRPKPRELKRRFNTVDYDLIRSAYKLKPIDRCKNVSHEPRELTFEYFRIDAIATAKEVAAGRNAWEPPGRTRTAYVATTQQVLEGMQRVGLRPALYEEFLAFDAKHPYDVEKRFVSLTALGSVAGYRVVERWAHNADQRQIHVTFWRGTEWGLVLGPPCFLAVRE